MNRPGKIVCVGRNYSIDSGIFDFGSLEV